MDATKDSIEIQKLEPNRLIFFAPNDGLLTVIKQHIMDNLHQVF